MAKFKKPAGDKKRPIPFGARRGGTNKPEARPVKPKLPGSRDRVRRRAGDLDQKASSFFVHQAALKRKGKKPQSGKTKPKARAAKPKPRSKRRGA